MVSRGLNAIRTSFLFAGVILRGYRLVCTSVSWLPGNTRRLIASNSCVVAKYLPYTVFISEIEWTGGSNVA